MSTSSTPKKIKKPSWIEEKINNAIRAVQFEHVSIRKAAIDYGIPESTLKGRLKRDNVPYKHKRKLIGTTAEEKLAEHIQKLESVGFELTKQTIENIALSFKKHFTPLKKEIKYKLGPDWYESFLKRHPTLMDNKKVKNTSNTDASNLRKEKVIAYINLLQKLLTENNLINKPSNIYCVDEINLRQYSVVGKSLMNVISISNIEQLNEIKANPMQTKVVTCCNAEGNFLPPYCLFKAREIQTAWAENMPPESVVHPQPTISFKKFWFIDWLQNHFIPRKKEGRCLLIMDNKVSHINSPNLVSVIKGNDVLLLGISRHITYYLHPLRQMFFKELKKSFQDACLDWGEANLISRLERRDFNSCFKKAWSKVATTEIGVTGFSEAGIYPFNSSTLLEREFTEHETSSSSKSTQDGDYKETFAATTDPLNAVSCVNKTPFENIVHPAQSTQEPIPSTSGETRTKTIKVSSWDATSGTLLQNVPFIAETEEKNEENQEIALNLIYDDFSFLVEYPSFSKNTQDGDNGKTFAALTSESSNTKSSMYKARYEDIMHYLDFQEPVPSTSGEASAETPQVPLDTTSWTLLQNYPPIVNTEEEENEKETEGEGEQNQISVQNVSNECSRTLVEINEDSIADDFKWLDSSGAESDTTNVYEWYEL